MESRTFGTGVNGGANSSRICGNESKQMKQTTLANAFAEIFFLIV